MIKINLIPEEYLQKLGRRALIARAVLFGVLIVLTVISLSVWYVARAKTLETELAGREAELRTLAGDVEKVKSIEAQISEVRRYLDSISRITRNRLIYTRFMQEILLDLPATIWFGSMSTSLQNNSLAVSFPVNARSAYDLAYWINALEENKQKYSDVSIGAITVTEESESIKVYATPMSIKYIYEP